MRTVHVLRRPLTENTVTDNILSNGCGALNIPETRVGSAGGTRRSGRATLPTAAGWSNMRGHGVEELGVGRWPANVILHHTESCRMVGETIVGPAGEGSFIGDNVAITPAHPGYCRPNSSFYTHKQPGSRKAYGEETVPVWECSQDCPVKHINAQSGTTSSPATYTRSTLAQGSWLHNDKDAGSVQLGYGDAGGASRYFKQFGRS